MALHEKLDEIRFQEIILLREQMQQLTVQVQRIADASAGQSPAR
jgi:hypothetical protein